MEDENLNTSAGSIPDPACLNGLSISTSLSGGPTLDSLLSPTASITRNSFTESALDDDIRFSVMSTVPLDGTRDDHDAASSDTTTRKSDSPNGTEPSEADQGVQEVTHTRTDSASSVPPSARLPFMISKLDARKSLSESVTSGNRLSFEGHQKIQEDFARLHKEQQDEAKNSNEIDWDFWGDVVSDYQRFAAEHGERLAQAIEKGIPNSLRGMVWQLMAASKDVDLEAAYLKLLKETSIHEKAILRDLGRTFPHHEYFNDGQGIGQENLFNVLKAYSLYDPQVGYCQGLPFVVAILLLHMPDEEAFSLLVRLMFSYDLRGHFLPEMPKLQLRLFQFERLIEDLLPVLNVHFLRQGVKCTMFSSQWFLTLFSYRFPLDIVFRIYDNCLASGIEAIFAFAIALLQKNEEELLSRKFDELMSFLGHQLLERYKDEEQDGQATYRVDDFVEDSFALKITPFMLDGYAHEYQEMVRNREAHALEVDGLRNSNRALSSQVKMLESSLAQLNTEHVEVLNQLVMARLRNEEMEGELVRYKLLYAEAMHENEDAQASRRISSNTTSSNTSSNSLSPGRH